MHTFVIHHGPQAGGAIVKARGKILIQGNSRDSSFVKITGNVWGTQRLCRGKVALVYIALCVFKFFEDSNTETDWLQSKMAKTLALCKRR